jgi:SagB-type dehydrogenase family enzyme
MIKIWSFVFLFVFPMLIRCNNFTQKINNRQPGQIPAQIILPDPVFTSNVSIEEALLKRRSVRRYSNDQLELKDISQLLWAAQGITAASSGGRTAPSAGALYPLELYVVCGNINTITPGVYHYLPSGHTLQLVAAGDKRSALTGASHMQGAINRSAAVIVIAAEYKRTTGKYPEKGINYVHMEAGHAAQNICLQAVSLKTGVVTMGSFNASKIKQIINLPEQQETLYLIPVGKLKE